jgi:hypothetical protein
MKLVDGYGPNGAVLGTTPVPQGNQWCHSSVEGTAQGPLVTVMWELVDTQAGTPSAVHADYMTIEVSLCNDPFADTDADNDVDHEDFAIFQDCFTGTTAAIPTEPAYCVCLDVEGASGPDGDVDAADQAIFEDCASGPGVPVDPACAGG